jgi:NADH-quinone oxidoreductase subunit L
VGRRGPLLLPADGFFFTKPSAADAGKKAFIVNRIGDFGFILGMLALFAAFGTLDFQELATKVAALPVDPATLRAPPS